jgi:hypothetical protein
LLPRKTSGTTPARQLEAKIRNGQIEEPEASQLLALSASIRALIEALSDG